MLRFITAGESHGPCLTAIIEGMPSNVPIDIDFINKRLADRQVGYGRGGRMEIEKDTAQILSGVRNGLTLGTPITLQIKNKDWENWVEVMSPTQTVEASVEEKKVSKPRPGHADLAGAIKYQHTDIRNVLERASARETAARTAVGAVAECLLKQFGISVVSHVTQVGPVKTELAFENTEEMRERIETSSLRCVDPKVEEEMREFIREAKINGDSVGGVFEVLVYNLPIGLGSYSQWDRKIDARLGYALMGLNAIKGVEIGLGFETAARTGSQVHDEIFHDEQQGFYFGSNHAGGLQAGMTNGQPVIARAAMKPIPTLYKPLRSVDLHTKETYEASIERSDICAIAAASVVGRAIVATEMAMAMLDKFAGDSLGEMKNNYNQYQEYVKSI